MQTNDDTAKLESRAHVILGESKVSRQNMVKLACRIAMLEAQRDELLTELQKIKVQS